MTYENFEINLEQIAILALKLSINLEMLCSKIKNSIESSWSDATAFIFFLPKFCHFQKSFGAPSQACFHTA